jgi:hypothetical protein
VVKLDINYLTKLFELIKKFFNQAIFYILVVAICVLYIDNRSLRKEIADNSKETITYERQQTENLRLLLERQTLIINRADTALAKTKSILYDSTNYIP